MGANDTLEQLNAARAYAVDLEAENARLEASIAKGHTIVRRAADLAAVTPFSLQEATEALTYTTDVWRRYQGTEAENQALRARLAAVRVALDRADTRLGAREHGAVVLADFYADIRKEAPDGRE